jgi:hypothetical protein
VKDSIKSIVDSIPHGKGKVEEVIIETSDYGKYTSVGIVFKKGDRLEIVDVTPKRIFGYVGSKYYLKTLEESIREALTPETPYTDRRIQELYLKEPSCATCNDGAKEFFTGAALEYGRVIPNYERKPCPACGKPEPEKVVIECIKEKLKIDFPPLDAEVHLNAMLKNPPPDATGKPELPHTIQNMKEAFTGDHWSKEDIENMKKLSVNSSVHSLCKTMIEKKIYEDSMRPSIFGSRPPSSEPPPPTITEDIETKTLTKKRCTNTDTGEILREWWEDESGEEWLHEDDRDY